MTKKTKGILLKEEVGFIAQVNPKAKPASKGEKNNGCKKKDKQK